VKKVNSWEVVFLFALVLVIWVLDTQSEAKLNSIVNSATQVTATVTDVYSRDRYGTTTVVEFISAEGQNIRA